MCTTTWKANKDLSWKLGNVRHKRSRERGMESFMPCSRQLQYNPADAHRETNVLTTNTHTHTHTVVILRLWSCLATPSGLKLSFKYNKV